MLNRFFLSLFMFVFALTIHIKPLLAADTSSTIMGSIQSENGTALSGAMIKVIHIPSASTNTSITNQVGKYSARGLRVGGPYTVIISADDYVAKKFNNVFLQLDHDLALSTSLVLETKTETLEIIGHGPQFSQQGSHSVFSKQDIEHAALVNRDIKDLARRTPLAVVDSSGTELSIAGSNPKLNSLTLDGVTVSDTFGLNANGYPAQRPPFR